MSKHHNRKLKRLISLRAVISGGRFKNREGLIVDAKFDLNGNIIVKIYPYANRGIRLLFKHKDTKRYYILTDDLLISQIPKDSFIKRVWRFLNAPHFIHER
jgi:hypothetical protein